MPSETKTIETFVEKPKAFSELRKGIVAGSVKSVDLAASYYERIEQANPRLNVYLSLTKERALEQAARDRGGPGLRRAPCERFHVPEAERLEIGKIEAADRSRDVAERVRSLVAVLVGIGKSAGTDGIEHDHAGSGHAAILGTGCLPPSD